MLLLLIVQSFTTVAVTLKLVVCVPADAAVAKPPTVSSTKAERHFLLNTMEPPVFNKAGGWTPCG
jgi:hypothetical protein